MGLKPQKFQSFLTQLSIFFVFLFHLCILSCNSSSCNKSNSLTPQQSMILSNFTSASYIPIDQQKSLRSAYQSLNRPLDNYLIQIEDTYLFDINDIQQCTNIPNYVTFDSMDNVWICLKNTVIALQCNKEWKLKIGCGTFIELHRPFHTQVLSSIMLSDAILSNIFSINLLNLCSGTYHLWFVYSVRVGKIIKNVKPIFVSYPSCQCP